MPVDRLTFLILLRKDYAWGQVNECLPLTGGICLVPSNCVRITFKDCFVGAVLNTSLYLPIRRQKLDLNILATFWFFLLLFGCGGSRSCWACHDLPVSASWVLRQLPFLVGQCNHRGDSFLIKPVEFIFTISVGLSSLVAAPFLSEVKCRIWASAGQV